MRFPGLAPSRPRKRFASPALIEPAPDEPPELPCEFKPQAKSAEHYAHIEAVVQEFKEKDFNAVKVVADSTLFTGMLLHDWSQGIRHSQKGMAALKLGLAALFLFLYPIYALVSILLIGLTYAYLNFDRNMSELENS